MKATLPFLLLFSFLSSQAQHSLSGKISDAEGPVYFATAALYKADSTLLSGEVTDEKGVFTLSKIPDGAYYLKISMLGYATQYQNVEFPRAQNTPMEFSLSEDENLLATAEIVARKPLLIQKSDRLVVNVADNVTSLNNNILDVMKNVPGVIVSGKKMSMAGQQNFTILINGKTTKYMDMQSVLQDMPGDNVQRVEVIHQPGAEFDAEGTGPIINIILKKNSLFGTNGRVRVGLAKGNDWKYRSSASFSHYQGNLNVYGGIGYRNSPWYDEMLIVRRVQDDVYTQTSIDPNFSITRRANLGADYDIDDRHRVGFSSRYTYNTRDNVGLNTTDINYGDATETDLLLTTDNTSDDFWRMLTINPYYSFDIDTAGQKFDVDFNYVNIENDGLSTLVNTEQNLGVNFGSQQYRQPGSTKLLTSQIDYAYPFSHKVKIGIGAKYSDASLDNDLGSFYKDTEGDDWQENLLQSNHFLFDETIGAAYTKLDWKEGKWSGTAGVRYEDSHSVGYSITLDSTTTNDIEKFFPSASLGYNLSKQLTATAAYSYRVDRPRYNNLNPFVYYLDPFTFERGNPLLRPSLSHSTKFNLAYENQPFFTVEYKKTNNAMVEVTEQNDATGETNLTTVNLESYNVFNTMLGFPLDFIPKISGYGAVFANHAAYNSEYLGGQFDRSRWTYTGYMQMNFELPGKIQTELSGWYVTGALEGLINGDYMYGVDLGFNRSFLNDKLEISLGCDGLIQRFFNADIIYQNMNLDIYNKWDAPVVNAQVSYRFGNQHMKSKKKRSSSASDVLNRAQKD